jgi:hypothetical protein
VDATSGLSWKDYTDNSSASVRSEVTALGSYVTGIFIEHQRAVELVSRNSDVQIQALKEYVNTMFEEQRRVVNLHQQNRKEYIDRIFFEQRQAKDASLNQLSSRQAAQQAAMESALGQLEQRIQAVQILAEERADSVRRETSSSLASSEKVIARTETNSEKQVGELQRSSDAQFGEIRGQLAALQKRLDQPTDATASTVRSIAYLVTVIGLTLTIIISAANYFAR